MGRNQEVVLSDEEREQLFNKLIKPNFDKIKSLVKHYANNQQDVDSHFNYTIEQMFRYIHTYMPERSLDTWIHIVTKRACFNRNKRQAQDDSYYTGEDIKLESCCGSSEMEVGTLVDNISDDVYVALMQIPPIKLSAFLLKAQGYTIKEITEIEYNRGHLYKQPDQAEEIIKSRIYFCRRQLQAILKERGITKNNYTSRKGNDDHHKNRY